MEDSLANESKEFSLSKESTSVPSLLKCKVF